MCIFHILEELAEAFCCSCFTRRNSAFNTVSSFGFNCCKCPLIVQGLARITDACNLLTQNIKYFNPMKQHLLNLDFKLLEPILWLIERKSELSSNLPPPRTAAAEFEFLPLPGPCLCRCCAPGLRLLRSYSGFESEPSHTDSSEGGGGAQRLWRVRL